MTHIEYKFNADIELVEIRSNTFEGDQVLCNESCIYLDVELSKENEPLVRAMVNMLNDFAKQKVNE